jgi:hypothetical protein
LFAFYQVHGSSQPTSAAALHNILQLRLEEDWCWDQLVLARAERKDPAPQHSCRGETMYVTKQHSILCVACR